MSPPAVNGCAAREGEIFDPHFEYVMARLKMKFRCGVCGSKHNPRGGAWLRCHAKASSLFAKLIYKENVFSEANMYRPSSQAPKKDDVFENYRNIVSERVVFVLLRGLRGLDVAEKVIDELSKEHAAFFGVEAQKLATYLKYPHCFYEEFGLLDQLKVVIDFARLAELAEKYSELVDVANRRILEAVGSLPEARVEEVRRNVEDFVIAVRFGGLLLPSPLIINRVFSVPPKISPPGREVMLFQVDEELRHAVVGVVKVMWGRSMDADWFLVTRGRVVTKLSQDEAKREISTLISKYLNSG